MHLAKLREWREARGLTQKQLAVKAGVAEGTVVRGERGETTYPHTARKMADALDVSVADIMENPPVPLVEASRPGQPETGVTHMRRHGDAVDVDDKVEPEVKADERLAKVRRILIERDAGKISAVDADKAVEQEYTVA